MTFAELGEEFVRLILTPDLLIREFRAAIPPHGLEAVETVEGYAVEYSAAIVSVMARRNGVTRIHPQPALHGYRFHFTVAFRLTLTVNILQAVPLPMPNLKETFEMIGTIPLTLEAQAYQPLELFIAYQELREEQIELSTEKAQWHDFAKRFGGLEEKARKKIVERVNSILAANEPRRRVDLLGMINKAVCERTSPEQP